MRIPAILSFAALVTAFGCADVEPYDKIDATFLGTDGKEDASGVREGSPDARGVLKLVNEASYEVLHDKVGLRSTTASKIWKHKQSGDTIDTLAELDAIPYVGPASFDRLLDYARENGYVIEPNSFTSSYSGQSSWKSWTSCDTQQAVYGSEPGEEGTYPVAIFLVATGWRGDEPEVITLLAELAGRGFVAASLQYANGSLLQGCSHYERRARCMFDPDSNESAIATICARSKADCSKGIVTLGFSQGGLIATLARDEDTRVQATYAMGIGNEAPVVGDLFDCMNDGAAEYPGARQLPADRLRIVDGANDEFFGGGDSANQHFPIRQQMRMLSGVSCDSTKTCTRPNGSGWYLVDDNETAKGVADHGYMNSDGGKLNEPRFALPANEPWSLGPNLDWLETFVSR